MNTTTTDISGVVLRETAKAYYVTLNGICDSVWIAKSLLSNVSVRYAEELGGRTIDADIPVWLWNKLPRKSGPIPYATRPW